MKRYGLLAISLIASLLLLAAPAGAGYWFQSGARAGAGSFPNGGASVSIQTVTPQGGSSGSMAFWVGENLPNGAFIQVGYVVENETGDYPAVCTASGCSGIELLNAGDAEWFYEYFLPNENGSFMGRIGPDASAGPSGTFHTYSFFSSGNTWHVDLDGNEIGNINLGVSSSGSDYPVALAEVANTESNTAQMKSVIFANLSAYEGGSFLPVSSGYATISYGVGSDDTLPNPYGVKEVGTRTNYFAVGSGLPLNTNNSRLWTLGYSVSILSKYGGLSGKNSYVAYTNVGLSAPRAIYLGNSSQVLFAGWTGSGLGAYTGPRENVSLLLDGNITERANWQQQYLVNVSTPFSSAYGSGWYNNGSIVRYGVANASVYESAAERQAFETWSNGNMYLNGTVTATSPVTLTSLWLHEYLVNATSSYGNATGSGWYQSGSYANLSVPQPVVNLSQGERLAFTSWSNGNANATISEKVVSPIGLRAQFARQYLVGMLGKDAQGNPINVSYFVINGRQQSGSGFFLDANQTSLLSAAYYKGVLLPANLSFTANGPSAFNVSLPVYDVRIRTVDLFDLPVNATVSLAYDNASISQKYSGPSGEVLVADVPSGGANATASYLGITERASVSDGKEATLFFVSLGNLVGIIAIIVLAACLAVLMRRRIAPAQ